MPEVLDLRELGGDDRRAERDGCVAPPSPPGTEPQPDEEPASAPRWRARAAIAVVIALAACVAYMLTAGPPARPPAPVLAEVAPPAQRAATQALDAWARFASTGELATLDGAFDPAGPQMAALRLQAVGLAQPDVGAYTFGADVLSVRAGRNPDEEVVVADVVLSRPGEADQRFAWEIVMRRSGQSGAWVVWTVRDRATPTGGAP